MLTNALLSMFQNRLKDLKTAIASVDKALKAARDAENDYPAQDKHLTEGLTAAAAASMTLSALEDFLPFIEGLTAVPRSPNDPPNKCQSQP